MSPWASLGVPPADCDSEKALFAQPDTKNEPLILESNDSRQKRSDSLSSILIIPSLLANVLFVLYLYAVPVRPRIPDLDLYCARHSTVYRSPLDEHVAVRYHTVQFNSSFSPQGTVYAAPPSPAVDNAWYDLGIRANHFTLPEHIDPTPYGIFPWQVKRDPDMGGGYIVFIEALHQLHCLNMLRKSSHWDYDYYYKTAGPSEDGIDHEDVRMRFHNYHCVEMLRERIQCSADRAVFGMVWIEGKDGSGYDASPEYSTERKCQDFDGLSSWVRSNTIYDDWHHAKFREGDKILAHDSGEF